MCSQTAGQTKAALTCDARAALLPGRVLAVADRQQERGKQTNACAENPSILAESVISDGEVTYTVMYVYIML